MKRTYEQSLTFFKTRKTSERGCGRELYQTPNDMIEKIVDNIILKRPELKNKLWVDPCAGDGRWQTIIESKGIKCKSFDIEPLNSKIEKQNFYDYNPAEDVFIIGNPPFSELTKFVDKALSVAESCYFLGGSQIITGKLSNKVSLLHRFEGAEGNQKDKRSKIGFIDTNGEKVYVWCCGAIFDNNQHNNFIRYKEYQENCFRTSVQCFCDSLDKRIEIIT